MDANMEISGTKERLNLCYMLGVAPYCVGLIFFRRDMGSSIENRNGYEFLSANASDSSLRYTLRNGLKLLLAASGMIFLYWCPFVKDLLKGASNLRVYVVFALVFFVVLIFVRSN